MIIYRKRREEVVMNKHFILLRMYDALLDGEELEKNACCAKYGYSAATFHRHIAFLRNYVGKEYGRALQFDNLTGKYVLAKK